MTTYIIFNFIVILGLTGFCFYLFYMIKENKVYRGKEENSKVEGQIFFESDWKISFLLIISFILIVTSFLSPFIFTREAINEDFDFSKTGAIGDTIGGLMNPFIALAGVIVTGLAFYMQFKANEQQRILFHKEIENSQNELQKQINNQNKQQELQFFESQFYEMLKLHRDNVSEMKINGYHFKEEQNKLKHYEKDTDGRKIFVTMKNEFYSILNLYTKTLNKSLNKDTFNKSYALFYYGLDEFTLKYSYEEKNFITQLKLARKRHEEPFQSIQSNRKRKEFNKDVKLYFNYKPFSGHSSRLSHYFRHLYLTVKLVVESEIVESYERKMKYLKILRAQLSDHEVIFLFYNWLGDFGYNWENEQNQFFTEFCILNNLNYNQLYDNSFISDQVTFLRTRKVEKRIGKMFDMDK